VQEVLDCLNVREIDVPSLPVEATTRSEWGEILKVVFREEHMVRPVDPAAQFDLKDYYSNPERYVSCFEAHLPYLDVLVNAIYWEERYPRLLTCDWARGHYLPGSPARLRVIGDISCDIQGSIEFTAKITTPDNPFFVYEPATGATRDGVSGHGPVVMAVDNLPCEFPRESSRYFSSVLRDMVAGLAAADWTADFDQLDLPAHLKKAVVAHKGELTPAYRYLRQHLA
jgi:alpha-aminoadipic semialdehyde synthase